MDPSGEHFSLKWNNFRSSLTEGFHNFLQEEMMVDVTLAAEGKFLQAHKLVLSVCSPYFKNLFTINPCKHPIVILRDVTDHELSYMLEFMYKGEVGVKHEDLPSFLKLADTLKLKGLAGVKLENGVVTYSTQFHPHMTNVRKRKETPCSDTEVDDVELQSDVCRLKELRPTRHKKQRLSSALTRNKSKSSHSKKMKGIAATSSDQDSGDEGNVSSRNSDLDKLVVGKVKDGGDQTRDDELDVFDNVDLDEGGKTSPDECDLSVGLLDNSTDAEQVPQALINYSALYQKRCGRKSHIWEYFIKYPSSATCKLCGRSFRGFRPHTSIEFHLRNCHPMEYQEFALIRERQREMMYKNDCSMFARFLYGFHMKT